MSAYTPNQVRQAIRDTIDYISKKAPDPKDDIIAFDKFMCIALAYDSGFPEKVIANCETQLQAAKAGKRKPQPRKPSVSGFFGGKGKRRTVPIGNAKVIETKRD